jgi:hypothetical protein
MNDTLIKYTTEKFETCAAVGNSGGLLRARAGQVCPFTFSLLGFALGFTSPRGHAALTVFAQSEGRVATLRANQTGELAG